jgi:plastocyanin
MGRIRLARLLVLFLALGLVASACSKKAETTGSASPSASGSGSGSGSGQMTIGSDKANNKGTASISGMEDFSVEVDNFYFKPTVLKGTAGQQIKLELENESSTLHNFTLADQNIDQDIQAGQKMEVTVKLPASGFLEFFCKYHKTSGMVGELSV